MIIKKWRSIGLLFICLFCLPKDTSLMAQEKQPDTRIEVGSQARVFTLNDSTGQKIELSEVLKSNIVVLWFTNLCPGCQKNLPALQKLSEDFQDKSVKILAVSVLGSDKSAVKESTEKHKITFPILIDPDGNVCRLYTGTYRPDVCPLVNLYLIDKTGMIKTTSHLPGHLTVEELREQLTKIISNEEKTEKLAADEIVKKMHLASYYAGDDMRVRVKMDLISKDDKRRYRELVMLRKNGDADQQKYFIYFYKPDDVRRTTFMVWKYPEKNDDRWIFIPAINMVRQIAAKDSRSSFVGSDFTYEDVSGRNLKADTHTLLKEEKINEKDCYVIQSIPKSEADYARKVSWIDKATFLPLKEEYYDVKEELVRVFTVDEIKKVVVKKTKDESDKEEKSFWTITKRTMKNIKTGHRTEVAFEEVEYNIGLEDNLFTEGNLKEPPKKWVK